MRSSARREAAGAVAWPRSSASTHDDGRAPSGNISASPSATVRSPGRPSTSNAIVSFFTVPGAASPKASFEAVMERSPSATRAATFFVTSARRPAGRSPYNARRITTVPPCRARRAQTAPSAVTAAGFASRATTSSTSDGTSSARPRSASAFRLAVSTSESASRASASSAGSWLTRRRCVTSRMPATRVRASFSPSSPAIARSASALRYPASATEAASAQAASSLAIARARSGTPRGSAMRPSSRIAATCTSPVLDVAARRSAAADSASLRSARASRTTCCRSGASEDTASASLRDTAASWRSRAPRTAAENSRASLASSCSSSSASPFLPPQTITPRDAASRSSPAGDSERSDLNSFAAARWSSFAASRSAQCRQASPMTPNRVPVLAASARLRVSAACPSAIRASACAAASATRSSASASSVPNCGTALRSRRIPTEIATPAACEPWRRASASRNAASTAVSGIGSSANRAM